MQPPWALKWVRKSNEGRGTLSISYLFLAVWPLCQHSRRDPLKKCPRNNQFWKSFKIQHHFPLCPSTFPSRGESLIPCPCCTGKNRTHSAHPLPSQWAGRHDDSLSLRTGALRNLGHFRNLPAGTNSCFGSLHGVLT